MSTILSVTTAVPDPTNWSLMLLGLGGLGGLLRAKRRQPLPAVARTNR
jgi:MYXO-CTERM domain-containing protein